MEKLHRFYKQKVLLNVKNGVCICMSLSFLGGWNIQDVVPKVESRGPWVKVLYNFYKPEQNQARWYLWLSRPSYRQILPDQDPPSTFFSILSSSPCLARHYSSHQQNYTSNNDRMLMCNVPNSRSVVVTSARGTLLLESHNRCAGLFTCTKQEYRIVIQAGNWLMFTPPLACPSSPAWHICSVH